MSWVKVGGIIILCARFLVPGKLGRGQLGPGAKLSTFLEQTVGSGQLVTRAQLSAAHLPTSNQQYQGEGWSGYMLKTKSRTEGFRFVSKSGTSN